MQIGLDQPLLIQLLGSEASMILNNLTTNQVLNLGIGAATESFITDLRGWVVAHGIVSRIAPDVWWFMGQHPEPKRVADHIDRYIVREDAHISNLSEGCSIGLRMPVDGPSDEDADLQLEPEFQRVPFHSFDPAAELIVSAQGLSRPAEVSQSGLSRWDEVRIMRLWPKMGIDIGEKCIPQELDRTSQAISFTKGCYLGQETIARLDALGQIQKKLCLLKIHSKEITNASQVYSENREVGTVTSAFSKNGTTWALAVIRRGHFAAGTELTVGGASAIVIDSQRS